MKWTSEFPTDVGTGWRWCFVWGRLHVARVRPAASGSGTVADANGRLLFRRIDKPLWGPWITPPETPEDA